MTQPFEYGRRRHDRLMASDWDDAVTRAMEKFEPPRGHEWARITEDAIALLGDNWQLVAHAGECFIGMRRRGRVLEAKIFGRVEAAQSYAERDQPPAAMAHLQTKVAATLQTAVSSLAAAMGIVMPAGTFPFDEENT
ncbi:hypothetical protein HYZ99_03020 [Candidatus Peregrinibacteria bacterium]|nr:hypothetical protein [Candidatus Peregrinibacteria bacterium]